MSLAMISQGRCHLSLVFPERWALRTMLHVHTTGPTVHSVLCFSRTDMTMLPVQIGIRVGKSRINIRRVPCIGRMKDTSEAQPVLGNLRTEA